MGYYISNGIEGHFQKAAQIAKLYGGLITSRPRVFADIPPGKALIVIVRNPLFEAAGFCYDEKEFEAFTRPEDPRPKSYVLIDWDKAVELTGYRAR